MKAIVFLYVTFSFLSCSSQSVIHAGQSIQDKALLETYKKFIEHRHDYGTSARDTILDRFKKDLIKTLADPKYAAYTFEALASKTEIIISKDNKLKIISWDELNGGTWHVYNSVFQYNHKGSSFSGFLSLDKNGEKPLFYTDIIHSSIQKIGNNEYLVTGYGTHGRGEDFKTFRLLGFSNNRIEDCNKCFDGQDRLVFIKPRGKDDKYPDFDSKKKIITYPLYKENQETGFLERTKTMVSLKYHNGNFIQQRN